MECKKIKNMLEQYRGNVSVLGFNYYVAGLLFYKFLSEKEVKEMNKRLVKYEINYYEAFDESNERFYGEKIKETSLNELGYFIHPKNLLQKIEGSEFEKAIQEVKFVKEINDIFNVMNLGVDKKYETFNLIKDLDIDDYSQIFEEIINDDRFNRGKGSFSTPQGISKLISKLIATNKNEINNIYDPASGISGTIIEAYKENRIENIYAQDINFNAYALGIMSLIINGVNISAINAFNEDSIMFNRKFDEKMDAVISTPPFNLKGGVVLDIADERFCEPGVLPPKSRLDYAFIESMLYNLDDEGIMVVLMAMGVLFRGGSEGKIRSFLISNKNYLDAVIALPSNLLEYTSIPTCILIFKKSRKPGDDIFFIDSTKHFTISRRNNILGDDNIEKIVDAYSKRTEILKFSRKVSLDEIIQNDYNLNMPRYIDSFDMDEFDIGAAYTELNKIEKRLLEVEKEFKKEWGKLNTPLYFK